MKAVIFDLDGVLVDSEPTHARALAKTLSEVGASFEEGRQVGWSDADVIQVCLAEAHLPAGAQAVACLLVRKTQIMLDLIEREHLQPTPGAHELISELKRNYSLALCSAGRRDEVNAILRAIGCDEFLTTRVVAEDVKHNKPAPDPYQLVADRLDLEPADCVAIEDSQRGVASARAAGCTVIAVGHTTLQSKLAGAHAFFSHIADLRSDLIANIHGSDSTH